MTNEQRIKLELLEKLGEITAEIAGNRTYINFKELIIDTKQVKIGEFSQFIKENIKPIIETAEIPKWVTAAEYCKLHKITRAGLKWRIDIGICLSKKGIYDRFPLYNLHTPAIKPR